MVNSIALFPNSMEIGEIERQLSRQICSMKKAEGLIYIRVSEGNIMSPGGPPIFSKALDPSWSSLEALISWVQRQITEDNADKEYMLENGVVLLYYEVTEHKPQI